MVEDQRNYKGLFLILGAGKFGKKALKYAIEQNYPFIILVDEDKQQLEEITSVKILDIAEFPENVISRLREQDPQSTRDRPEIFGLNSKVDMIFPLFDVLIPDWIVPVVPMHIVAAYSKWKLEASQLEIKIPNEGVLDQISSQLPDALILNRDVENAVITLSYAPKGALCPDNCLGPLHFCPNFNIDKPRTITEIIGDLGLSGFHYQKINLESKQLTGGLGAIPGEKFEEGVNSLKRLIEREDLWDNFLIVSTTCNCHGVINIFQIRGSF